MGIISGSVSFLGRFGDHSGLGIISGAVQIAYCRFQFNSTSTNIYGRDGISVKKLEKWKTLVSAVLQSKKFLE